MSVTKDEARRFYDHFGRKQDSQAFYEDAAVDNLIEHAQFNEAHCVVEFGCGTGRVAQRLLQHELPESASYSGIDISPVMLNLAQQRLSSFGSRVKLTRASDAIHIEVEDHSVERLLSTYVLDLLSESDIKAFLAEARRVLKPGPAGKLCLVSLSEGISPVSKVIIKVWRWIYRLRPILLGGCRPLQLNSLLDQNEWQLEYHHTLVSYGVPSEIAIATPVSGEARVNDQ